MTQLYGSFCISFTTLKTNWGKIAAMLFSFCLETYRYILPIGSLSFYFSRVKNLSGGHARKFWGPEAGVQIHGF